MFNTNKTLEQKVKARMASLLHRAFIEHSIIILSEPHLYSRTNALSEFTTAFKAVLNDWNSTGHRVADNHDGFNSPTETEKEK